MTHSICWSCPYRVGHLLRRDLPVLASDRDQNSHSRRPATLGQSIWYVQGRAYRLMTIDLSRRDLPCFIIILNIEFQNPLLYVFQSNRASWLAMTLGVPWSFCDFPGARIIVSRWWIPWHGSCLEMAPGCFTMATSSASQMIPENLFEIPFSGYFTYDHLITWLLDGWALNDDVTSVFSWFA